jgi:hypothetical protein
MNRNKREVKFLDTGVKHVELETGYLRPFSASYKIMWNLHGLVLRNRGCFTYTTFSFTYFIGI